MQPAQSAENACKSSKTGFGFAPDWLKMISKISTVID